MYLLVSPNKACATAGSGAKDLVFSHSFSPRSLESRHVWFNPFTHFLSFTTCEHALWHLKCGSSAVRFFFFFGGGGGEMMFQQPSTLAASPEGPCAVSGAGAAVVWWGCIGAVRCAVFRCGVAWGAVRFLTARRIWKQFCLSETWLEMLLFFSPA